MINFIECAKMPAIYSMKNLLRRIVLILLLLSGFTLYVTANHIVGGELQMQRKGNAGTFEITLIQFWDQNNLIIPTPNTAGNRDSKADLFIYRKKDKSLVEQIKVDYIRSEAISYQNKACASSRLLSTIIGIYKGTVSLTSQRYSDPEGYYIAWERCCRNDDINNITQPGDNGMVFYLEFPPVNVANSSPEFVAPNGQYICSNRQFSMSMAATDADGDELRYSLVTPMRGTTNANQPYGTDVFKSSYPLVTWSSGISLGNVIPGPSPLKVSSTGELTVNANRIGLYVFTIQCEEYRNGKKIGLIRRDFQLLVIDCNDDLPEQPVIKLEEQPVSEVSFCPESPIELKTESSADWAYQWQLNGSNIPGEVNASIMVKDSGRYSVVKSYTKKCSRDTTSIVVNARFAPPISATISAIKKVICEGESIDLLANGGNVTTSQAVQWSRDNVILAATAPTLPIDEAGTYTLRITNEVKGCSGNDTIKVSKESLSVTLPDKKGVVEGSKTTLKPVVFPLTGTYTYQWSPPQGLVSAPDQMDATVQPMVETEYKLNVRSENGCVAEASILVFVIDKMHIPTAFSPNRDGVNDTFEIYNSKDQIVEIRIYNRWGQVIFNSSGYDKPWDGTYQNESVPPGSYPYIIKTAEQDVKGTITLLK
jgi:gliding motility-associated-like protein